MKKSFRITSVILSVFLMAAFLTSCKKSPSDTSQFKQLAKEYKFEIYDVSNQYVNAPQIKEATIALPSDQAFQIEFYTITDRESAKQLYLAESDVVDGYKDANYSGSSSNGQNYAKRSIVTNGKYLMVSYIENTLVYVPPTDEKNKKTIEEFLKKLNY